MGIATRVAGAWAKRKLRRETKKATAPVSGPAKALGLLKKEAKLYPVLHKEVQGALRTMISKDPSLRGMLDGAYGYAVFPSVGKATLLLGGAFGIGEVFEHGRVTNYAAVIQLTIGVQLGGQTFHELVVFDTKKDLERFKEGKVVFAANASAVLISAGAAASSSRKGMHVFVHAEGGMMVEAAIGGQKFIVKEAFLGRLKLPEPKATVKSASKFGVGPPPMR